MISSSGGKKETVQILGKGFKLGSDQGLVFNPLLTLSRRMETSDLPQMVFLRAGGSRMWFLWGPRVVRQFVP